MSNDISPLIQQQVEEAYQAQMPLEIIGNSTKKFYGNSVKGTPLVVSQHSGIISYEPTELVITARAGTPLDEIEEALNKHNQQLAFEPPHFSQPSTDTINTETHNDNLFRIATLGGTIACGLSGPARANNGSARDFVLGCEIINGRGEQLKFGGQVMKNVAGYDVSRLMCGSFGTLGIILNVSLKVLPKPEVETSLSFTLPRDDAYSMLQRINAKAYPITASCYFNNVLTIRLAGNAQAVKATQEKLGGELEQDDDHFWSTIREQSHSFFNTKQPLWRISTKFNTKLDINDLAEENTRCLTEWHGALHWLTTKTPATVLRQYVEKIGGHATLFKNNLNENDVDIFHPLQKPLLQIHKNLKNAFDPENILNRNKMYDFSKP